MEQLEDANASPTRLFFGSFNFPNNELRCCGGNKKNKFLKLRE